MCVFAVGLCCITAKGLNKSETKLELLNSRSQNICIKGNADVLRGCCTIRSDSLDLLIVTNNFLLGL